MIHLTIAQYTIERNTRSDHEEEHQRQPDFFELQYFGLGLRLARKKNSNTNPVSTKCRLQIGYKMQTRYKMQTAGWVQIAD